MPRRSPNPAASLLAAGFCVASAGVLSAAPQVYVKDTASIPSGSPFNNSRSQEVDFGDVDLDGDLDAVFADGGEDFVDQNRIWINLGGLQGGALGSFVDETAARLPLVSDASDDVELADIDGDADLDWFTSNNSTIVNQTNRWWVNTGGAQGGTLGYFVDETASRYVGLGGPGSSVAPSHVLPAGGFIAWSGDSDFADIDADGDLDLVQTSYGGAFGGNVPTRMFLNDGAGYFSELNPSGFQLLGSSIPNGSPALWAEGAQQHNTLDTTGQQADIAGVSLDADFGDLDGDFDLDLVLGDRQQLPRAFQNRSEEAGATTFRDVTHAWFSPAHATGWGHYEQELGDVDRDGDLDLFGLNWLYGGAGVGFLDALYRNAGDGTFGLGVVLPGSQADDNEADFTDFDGDGDLDVYVSNFSGADKLYENLGAASGDYALVDGAVSGLAGTTTGISWDTDLADLDGDGDQDAFVALDNNQPNVYLRNATQVPDAVAPDVPLLEPVGDQEAGPGGVRVRAHVLDNGAYYVTAFAAVRLEVAVGGFALPPIAVGYSGGQVFRGELPANLLGAVSYAVRATDSAGNAGLSGTQGYAASTALPIGGPYGTGAPGSLGT
ncbi:MAG TPA: FG-GAP-like repeat-containing protein, partial [Planctomycetota bacterium]|nr:FG-GAP-like repeat-containing protein [Planctomycetota bacterium]